MDIYTIALVVLSAINVAAFSVMTLDKYRSTKNTDNRIPEGVLFFFASIFGSIGILAGMLILRHKIRKWYFAVGIPALIIEQAVLAYCVADGVKFFN